MLYLSIGDIFRAIAKSVIITIVFVSLLLIGYYLMNINVNFAYYISDALDIPRNLSLTIISAGFANNIIILMTIFELGFSIWVGNKITKTRVYDNVKEFVINL